MKILNALLLKTLINKLNILIPDSLNNTKSSIGNINKKNSKNKMNKKNNNFEENGKKIEQG